MPKVNIMLNQHSKYYKIFENDVQGVDKKIMLAALKEMEIQTNLIVFSGSTLVNIKESVKVSTQQVRNAISRLAKLNLLEKTLTIKNGYVVNPSFAWKGDETTIWRFH